MSPPVFVIIGAGIFGSSIAHALARKGQGERVVVLDRQPPASGATSRAAALVSLARDKTHWIPLVQETYRAIEGLRSEHGADVGLRTVGAVHAGPAPVLAKLRALGERCEPFGITWREIDRAATLRRVPWLRSEAIDGAIEFPQEAYVEPYQLSSAYLRAAQSRGVKVMLDSEVTAIDRRDGAVSGVTLADGRRIAAAHVVVAAGAWSNRLTVPLGVALPQAPVRSQYWITEPSPKFPRDGPIVLLPGIGAYARPEVGGLLFGVREPRSVVADFRTLPADLSGFCFDAADPEGWGNLEAAAGALSRYVPALEEVGIAHYITGPSCYTADGGLVAGRVDSVPGLSCVAGCNGAGIAVSGGLGRFMAECVLGEEPFVDPAPHRPQRLGTLDPASTAFLEACAAARSRKTSG